MTPTPEVHLKLRQYLLGHLAEDLREEIETGLLADQDLFEELLIAEDELVDDYLSATLSPDENTAFEQHFLCTPERYEKVRFARALQRRVRTVKQSSFTPSDQPAPPFLISRSFFIRASAITMALLIAAGALWFWRNRSPQPTMFATLHLTPTLSNRADGPQAPRLKMPLPEQFLKLILSLPDQTTATAYRAELENEAGEKSSWEAKLEGSEVTITMASADLRQGRYAIRLFSVDANRGPQRIPGSYFFTVE
jgi:hypothetical protein